MKITCISDLHGHFPLLKGGDILIIAGDITASDTRKEYEIFAEWLSVQEFEKKIVVAGTHDNLLQDDYTPMMLSQHCDYLQDSSTEYQGIKIYGSPWSKTFLGIGSKCKAFTVENDECLEIKWDLIPEDVDILITHCPPYCMLDSIFMDEHIGSKSLRNFVISDDFSNLRLHVFGQSHKWGGRILETSLCKFVNASLMNETYDPINRIITVDL